MVDLDPQAHLTMHLGVEPGKAKPGVYELLGGSASLEECLRTVRPNMDIVPAEIDLAGAEVELVGVVGREILLRDALDPARDRYDVVLIDCPPSLGLLTINALSAVEEVFIALQPHFLAMQGLGKLLETVSLVHRRINAQLSISGVVLCMYDSRTALCGEVAAEVKRFFKSEHPLKALWQDAHIFKTHIRRNIRLAEAPGHGKTIFEYAPSSHGAQDYQALAEELLAFWRGEITEEQPLEEKPEAMTGATAEEDDPAKTTVPVEAGTTTAPALAPIVPCESDEVQIAAGEAGLHPAQTEEPPLEKKSETMADEANQQEESAKTIVPVEAGTSTVETAEPIVLPESDEAQVVAAEAEFTPAQEGTELSIESESPPATEAVNPIEPSESPVPFENYESTTDEDSTQYGSG